MEYPLMLDLQLFADGGAAATASAGEATGETAQAAAVQGTKADAPLTRDQRRAAALARQEAFLAGAPQERSRPASGEAEDANTLTFAERMKADPELKKAAGEWAEGIIKDRLKNSKQAEAKLEAFKPALERLATKYGVDATNVEAIAESVLNDDEQYEQEALEQGLPVETVKELDRLKRESEELKAQREQAAMEQQTRARFADLQAQIPNMQQTYPGFDMETEMQNPKFAMLLHPMMDYTLEEAYLAVHAKDMLMQSMDYATKRGALNVSRSIQAGARRPSENGLSGTAPSQAAPPNLSRMSDADKKAYLRSIRERVRNEGDIITLR